MSSASRSLFPYSLPEISMIVPYTIEVMDAMSGDLQLKTARAA